MSQDHLIDLVQRLGTPRILVIGDVILDRYVEGSAGRVSPEAPVLVFDWGSQRTLLGGAGNVAANLVALGASTALCGVVGSDDAARELLQLLSNEGIETGPLVVDDARPTTVKSRFVSRTAQVLRVDQERRTPVAGAVQDRILAVLAERPFPYDAVLLSDYGKGVLTPEVIAAAVAAAHSRDGVAVVDPKGSDYSRYRGVDLLTPNREEAEAATGMRIDGVDSLRGVAQRLREITAVPAATITLGKDGIFFEGPDGEPGILPTEARSVFDVTGAGDTVVATLTLARACGVGLEDSLRLANCAAGITVGHFGTWAVSRDELLSMLGRPGQGKVLAPEEAATVAARLRTEGKRVVFTNGCFDIIHPGHTDYLSRARAYGDALMVAVNTDASVRRQGKGDNRPVNPLEDRMDVLAALQSVDFVVPFDADTPEELIRLVTPHVLVKGEDWRDKGVVGRDWVEAHGGSVVLVPLRQGCSTTSIIDRIRGS